MFWQVCALASTFALAACGGGGQTVSIPAPAPNPGTQANPTPTSTPTPAPAPSFVTPEYNRSDGPSLHRAIPAWQAGATGSGVTIAVVDSGIDSDSPEFAGRIVSASTDVAGRRGLDNPDSDHGTRVAQVAAAAHDNTGVMGIAWQASILALRADRPGSCATADPDVEDSGCKFDDTAIAAGVDRAVQSGARIVNLSLGGSLPDATLQDAIARATASGVVIVVSAGNDGDSTDPDIDPDNPDPFASGLRAVGNGNVIIAGSVNNTGAFSAFSNRAGSESTWFLSAQGEGVCCAYENGVMKVETDASGTSFVTLFSGTSFSAPQIAGAAALLMQAFPNLSGNQVVDLLLRSARDAGTAGTDSTFGRGILDIASAFAPQGATNLAGTSVQVPLDGSLMTGSSAMGDALSRVSLGTVVLDAYERAYAVDLGGNLAGASVVPRLAPALTGQVRSLSASAGGTAIAFTVDGSAAVRQLGMVGALRLDRRDAGVSRVLAGRVIARIGAAQRLGFAFGLGADGLVGEMQGRRGPAFLIARDPLDDFGFARKDQLALAWRKGLGPWGLTFSAERARLARPFGTLALPALHLQNAATTRLGLAIDRQAGPVALTMGLGWLGEEHSILGARLRSGTVASAQSLFLDAGARWQVAQDWDLGAAWRSGQTWAQAPGLFAHTAQIASNGWSFDVSRAGAFSTNDRLSLRLSQPLRVSGGGLNLLLPTAWDYASRSAIFAERHLSLVPRGREMVGEVNLQQPLWGGWASTSLYARRNPGHLAGAPTDLGAGLSWNSEF